MSGPGHSSTRHDQVKVEENDRSGGRLNLAGRTQASKRWRDPDLFGLGGGRKEL